MSTIANTITYPALSEACENLKAEGEKITIRNLHRLLGGSYSTLSPLYRQWQKEQEQLNASSCAISNHLEQVLVQEFKRVAKEACQKASLQLKAAEAQIQEMEAIVNEHERQEAAIRDAHARQVESLENTVKKLQEEKQCLTAQNKLSTQKIEALEASVKTLTQRDNESTLKKAVTEAQYHTVMEQKHWLEKQLHDWQARCQPPVLAEKGMRN